MTFQTITMFIPIILFFLTREVLSAPSLDPALRTCEPIRVDLCRGLGYNATGMPNFIGHELQSDADFTLKTFMPLIQYGCSAQLQFFLCSVYVPMCTEKALNPIGPCRGLCESVRARCYPVLQGFGFSWPSALDCQRFPNENNHEHMCMEGPGEGISDTSPPVVRTPPIIGIPCQRMANPQLYSYVNRSGRCAPLCGADVLFEDPDKRLAEVWSSAWGAIGLAASIVALLVVVAAPSGGAVPSLWPLCLCHAATAFGWGVRALVGRNLVSCGRDLQAPNVSLLLSDGLSNANCTVVFLLMYYFTIAAAVW